MVHGCSLYPALFSVLMKVVEEAGVGVQLSNDKSTVGMLFADDFVGVK